MILENLETPDLSFSPHKEIIPFTMNPPSKLKRISKFLSKVRMSVSNAMKGTQNPFENKNTGSTTKVISSMKQANSNPMKNFIALNPNSPRERPSSEKIEDNNNDFNRYAAFHKEFNHKNFWQSYFIVWSLFKQLLYALIITVSYHKPYEGLIVGILVQFVFMVSLLTVKPFKERKELLQNLFNETCTLSAMVFAFCLAYMDKNENFDGKMRINMGWGIVFSNLLLILAFLLRMIVAWISIMYEMGKECLKGIKKKCKKNKIDDENATGKENPEFNKGILDKIIEMENFLR